MKYQLVLKETNEIVSPHYVGLAPNGELYIEGMNVSERYHIRRFTGLKDSKGTEIYEGDIMQSLTGKRQFSQVVMLNGCFKLQYTFTRHYQGSQWQETSHFPIYENSHMIVGTIYQNADLLTLIE